MDGWVPKGGPVQPGASTDGAFERFLTAAIAAIITIMFSWRLLDDMNDQDETATQVAARTTLSFPDLSQVESHHHRVTELAIDGEVNADNRNILCTGSDVSDADSSEVRFSQLYRDGTVDNLSEFTNDSASPSSSFSVEPNNNKLNEGYLLDNDYIDRSFSPPLIDSPKTSSFDSDSDDQQPRELDSDEEYFLSTQLEPILEEDSDDFLNTSDENELENFQTNTKYADHNNVFSAQSALTLIASTNNNRMFNKYNHIALNSTTNNVNNVNSIVKSREAAEPTDEAEDSGSDKSVQTVIHRGALNQTGSNESSPLHICADQMQTSNNFEALDDYSETNAFQQMTSKIGDTIGNGKHIFNYEISEQVRVQESDSYTCTGHEPSQSDTDNTDSFKKQINREKHCLEMFESDKLIHEKHVLDVVDCINGKLPESTFSKFMITDSFSTHEPNFTHNKEFAIYPQYMDASNNRSESCGLIPKEKQNAYSNESVSLIHSPPASISYTCKLMDSPTIFAPLALDLNGCQQDTSVKISTPELNEVHMDASYKQTLFTESTNIYCDADLSSGLKESPQGYTFVRYESERKRSEVRIFNVDGPIAEDFESFINNFPLTSESVDGVTLHSVESDDYSLFVRELTTPSTICLTDTVVSQPDVCILSGNLVSPNKDLFHFPLIPSVSSVANDLFETDVVSLKNSRSASYVDTENCGPSDSVCSEQSCPVIRTCGDFLDSSFHADGTDGKVMAEDNFIVLAHGDTVHFPEIDRDPEYTFLTEIRDFPTKLSASLEYGAQVNIPLEYDAQMGAPLEYGAQMNAPLEYGAQYGAQMNAPLEYAPIENMAQQSVPIEYIPQLSIPLDRDNSTWINVSSPQFSPTEEGPLTISCIDSSDPQFVTDKNEISDHMITTMRICQPLDDKNTKISPVFHRNGTPPQPRPRRSLLLLSEENTYPPEVESKGTNFDSDSSEPVHIVSDNFISTGTRILEMAKTEPLYFKRVKSSLENSQEEISHDEDQEESSHDENSCGERLCKESSCEKSSCEESPCEKTSFEESLEEQDIKQVPVFNCEPKRPRSLKEIRRKLAEQRAISQVLNTQFSRPIIAPFKLPDHLLTPSRLKILASRKRFLSMDSIDSNDKSSLQEQFDLHRVNEQTKERRYKSPNRPLSTMSACFSNEGQLQKLRSMINLSKSSPSIDRPPIDHLHEGCIFTPQGRKDILNKTMSIENLTSEPLYFLQRNGSLSSMLETDIDTGKASESKYFDETNLDLIDCIFQQTLPLERSASMSDLHSGQRMVGPSTTLSASSEKTGKGRFAHRHYKKSKSLCTLETNIDDVSQDHEDNLKRVPSVHELRVSKSLQKLNVPDWFKQSSLSKSSSCLLKYGSNSTMNSFSFSHSLVSSPSISTPLPSTSVVIKTRVVAPSSSRLRSTGVSLGSSNGKKIPSVPVKLPSEKYREKEIPKSLMPIPIVPFAKIRAMFENKTAKHSLSQDKEKEQNLDNVPLVTVTRDEIGMPKEKEKEKDVPLVTVTEDEISMPHIIEMSSSLNGQCAEDKTFEPTDSFKNSSLKESSVGTYSLKKDWYSSVKHADTKNVSLSKVAESKDALENYNTSLTFPSSTKKSMLASSEIKSKPFFEQVPEIQQKQEVKTHDQAQESVSAKSFKNLVNLSFEKQDETNSKPKFDSALYEKEPKRLGVAQLSRHFETTKSNVSGQNVPGTVAVSSTSMHPSQERSLISRSMQVPKAGSVSLPHNTHKPSDELVSSSRTKSSTGISIAQMTPTTHSSVKAISTHSLKETTV